MNPDSLCAKCQHLKCSSPTGVHFCNHRNGMNRHYPVIFIDRGFKTCINFKPQKENTQPCQPTQN